MLTKAEISRMLGVLKAGFPSYKPPQDPGEINVQVEVYFRVLQDLELELLDAAAMHIIGTATWFPSPGQIRQVAVELSTNSYGRLSGVEKWGEIKLLVSKYGADNWTKASAEMDEQTRRAIQAIGWRDYCMSDIDDEQSWRARFVEAYNAIWKRADVASIMLPTVADTAKRIQSATQNLAAQLSAPTRKPTN